MALYALVARDWLCNTQSMELRFFHVSKLNKKAPFQAAFTKSSARAIAIGRRICLVVTRDVIGSVSTKPQFIKTNSLGPCMFNYLDRRGFQHVESRLHERWRDEWFLLDYNEWDIVKVRHLLSDADAARLQRALNKRKKIEARRRDHSAQTSMTEHGYLVDENGDIKVDARGNPLKRKRAARLEGEGRPGEGRPRSNPNPAEKLERQRAARMRWRQKARAERAEQQAAD